MRFCDDDDFGGIKILQREKENKKNREREKRVKAAEIQKRRGKKKGFSI